MENFFSEFLPHSKSKAATPGELRNRQHAMACPLLPIDCCFNHFGQLSHRGWEGEGDLRADVTKRFVWQPAQNCKCKSGAVHGSVVHPAAFAASSKGFRRVCAFARCKMKFILGAPSGRFARSAILDFPLLASPVLHPISEDSTVALTSAILSEFKGEEARCHLKALGQ